MLPNKLYFFFIFLMLPSYEKKPEIRTSYVEIIFNPTSQKRQSMSESKFLLKQIIPNSTPHAHFPGEK